MANHQDIVPVNASVLTGMSIDELEDRLEMQLLGMPIENALAVVPAVVIVIAVALPIPP